MPWSDKFQLVMTLTDPAMDIVSQELGLPVEPDVPLLAFIGRLDHQKGVDLIRDSFDWLMDQGAQLVMLGSGRFDLESSLKCVLALHTCLALQACSLCVPKHCRGGACMPAR